MPDRSLDSLSSAFKPLAYEWVARVTARGVAVMIVQTGRSLEEHQKNLKAGTSAATLSMHLPRRMRWPAGVVQIAGEEGRSDAMDIAPYDQYQLHGPDKAQWDTSDPAWGIIIEEAERVGLRSGGRWRQPFDPGHAELVMAWTVKRLAEERSRPFPKFRNIV